MLNSKLIVEALKVAEVHLFIIQLKEMMLTFTSQAEMAQLILHLNCLLYLMSQMLFFFLFKSTP